MSRYIFRPLHFRGTLELSIEDSVKPEDALIRFLRENLKTLTEDELRTLEELIRRGEIEQIE